MTDTPTLDEAPKRNTPAKAAAKPAEISPAVYVRQAIDRQAPRFAAVYPKGLDVERLLRYAAEEKTVDGFPGGEPLTNQQLFELEVQILIPAALENQITMENAPQIRASIVVEGANGPTTPEAHRHLHERGVFVVPDILANSGGVTVSYFEWVQDRYGYFWELDEVNVRLEKKMCEAFDDVLQTSLKYKVDLRTAAYIVAISRVGTVTKTRGMYA